MLSRIEQLLICISLCQLVLTLGQSRTIGFLRLNNLAPTLRLRSRTTTRLARLIALTLWVALTLRGSRLSIISLIALAFGGWFWWLRHILSDLVVDSLGSESAILIFE